MVSQGTMQISFSRSAFLRVRVALPTPLRQAFTYRIKQTTTQDLTGCRLLVPFGKRKLIGICLGWDNESEVAPDKLRNVEAVLDESSVFPDDLWRLLNWAADYYLHPIGDVLAAALPKYLREGKAITPNLPKCWQINPDIKPDKRTLKRMPAKKNLYEFIQKQGLVDSIQLDEHQTHWKQHLAFLQDNKWLICETKRFEPALNTPQSGPALNQEQLESIKTLHLDSFQTLLLEGVTGSGKTEVYLAWIKQVLEASGQILILVPEIGLTPQLHQRVEDRTGQSVILMHSNLTDRARHLHHFSARSGQASIVLGTRSAIFTPFKSLQLIIIDEEHDASLKQQEGFKYHARDLAIVRARNLNIPIVLGSATPSLESLYNTRTQRYAHAKLTQRAGLAQAPKIDLIDLKTESIQDGISHSLVQNIQATLDMGNQALIFINRRGFAPVLFCPECGWQAQCQHCETRLTIHKHSKVLKCHHCHSQQTLPQRCPDCDAPELLMLGEGTQRVSEALEILFPQFPIIRIDRDTTQNASDFTRALEPVIQGKACILVGTQMLAKGHHFPKVTLSAIVNADHSLYSADFRAHERLAQLLVQVAGRSGRESARGQVLIQSWMPENPFFSQLLNLGYAHMADQWLQERIQMHLPPVAPLAYFRADATEEKRAERFLKQLVSTLEPHEKALVLGPVPALLAKKGGRFRFVLMIQTENRKLRHQLTHQLIHTALKQGKHQDLRWSIDIDPLDAL